MRAGNDFKIPVDALDDTVHSGNRAVLTAKVGLEDHDFTFTHFLSPQINGL